MESEAPYSGREYSPLCGELLSRVDKLQDAFDSGSKFVIVAELDELHRFLTDAIEYAAVEARVSTLGKREEAS